jgi:hypothetical protein
MKIYTIFRANQEQWRKMQLYALWQESKNVPGVPQKLDTV